MLFNYIAFKEYALFTKTMQISKTIRTLLLGKKKEKREEITPLFLLKLNKLKI